MDRLSPLGTAFLDVEGEDPRASLALVLGLDKKIPDFSHGALDFGAVKASLPKGEIDGDEYERLRGVLRSR